MILQTCAKVCSIFSTCGRLCLFQIFCQLHALPPPSAIKNDVIMHSCAELLEFVAPTRRHRIHSSYCGSGALCDPSRTFNAF